MLILYTKIGGSYDINYALKNYFSLDKDQIKKVMKLPSRWASVNKKYPPYVLHERGAYLLN